MNKTAIVEGMDVMQGFDMDLPSHGLTWLPTLLSAQFLNSRNPNMSPFPGETNKSLDDGGIGPLPSGSGHQFILMEIITYSGMDLPSLALLPAPPSLDFLITLYTLYIIEISHTIFFFWSRNTFHSERGKTNGLTTMGHHP